MSDKTEVVSVRLPAGLLSQLREQATDTDTTVSRIIRGRLQQRPMSLVIHIGAPPNHAPFADGGVTHQMNRTYGGTCTITAWTNNR